MALYIGINPLKSISLKRKYFQTFKAELPVTPVMSFFLNSDEQQEQMPVLMKTKL